MKSAERFYLSFLRVYTALVEVGIASVLGMCVSMDSPPLW